MSDIEAVSAEIFADHNTRRVVTIFAIDGERSFELHLHPEMAREYAFNLTRAALAIEDEAP